MDRRSFLTATPVLAVSAVLPATVEAKGVDAEIVGGNLKVPSLGSFTVLEVTTPETTAPAYLFVCTWEDLDEKELESYVRVKVLSRELQDRIREEVRGLG